MERDPNRKIFDSFWGKEKRNLVFLIAQTIISYPFYDLKN